MANSRKKKDDFNPIALLDEVLSSVKQENIKSKGSCVDVLTFAEDFLKVNLFPAQVIILKFLYKNSRFNEHLEINQDDIKEIKSWSTDQHWIFDGEMAKIKTIENEENICKDLVLVLGRRSGKSYITSLISVYEAYKLLELGDPQLFYGIDSDIRIINTAVTKPQALNIIFKQIIKFINRCAYFHNRIGREKEGEIYLLTDKDLEINEKIKERDGKNIDGSIVLMSGSSNSDALRGHTAAVVIYDEMAHYVKTDGSSSAYEVYNALSRSTLTLAKEGDGRNIVISSPYLKTGFFYDHYENAKRINSMQMFQIPTSDANPEIPEATLMDEYNKNPETYSSEFGAQFLAVAGNAYFPFDRIVDAITKRTDLRKTKKPIPGFEYYFHIDPATNSDNWAFLIAHPEWRWNHDLRQKELIIVQDYSEFWSPPLNGDPIDEDKIMDETILPLIKTFRPVSTTYDAKFSVPQMNKLTKARSTHKLLSFGGRVKNEIYATLRDYLIQGRVELCHDDNHLEGELKAILVDYSTKIPKILKDKNNREFPNDDLVDCLGGVVYQIALGPTGRTRLPRCRIANTGNR